MKEDFRNACWSWDHIDQLVAAQRGQYVCEKHSKEHSKIEAILKSLEVIQNAVTMYLNAAIPQKPHPNEAIVLQDVIEDFFLQTSAQLRAGRAFRFELASPNRQELDIVLDTDSSDWIGKTRDNVLANPPLAHIEVAYRSKFSIQKFLGDYQSVHETVISGASLNPPQKVWAAFVGIGPGWQEQRERILSLLHEYFHSRKIGRVSSSNSQDFYDFPDIVAIPGLVLIKQRYVDEPGLLRYWPVYVEFPSAINDPAFSLRPLAIARGFFANFVRGTKFPGTRTGRAWAQDEDASIMGPNARINHEEPRTFSLTHAPDSLFAMDLGDSSRTRFLHYVALDTICSAGHHYRYERRKGSQFDEISLTYG
jgi:hypothetical protein